MKSFIMLLQKQCKIINKFISVNSLTIYAQRDQQIQDEFLNLMPFSSDTPFLIIILIFRILISQDILLIQKPIYPHFNNLSQFLKFSKLLISNSQIIIMKKSIMIYIFKVIANIYPIKQQVGL
ncbi:hypothetical protein pb186bvf_001851 [Paramecium bursaria]